MLNVNNLLSAHRIKQFLTKNNIEIVHFIPGRVRLKLSHWQNRQGELAWYINELERDANITSVSFTPETGSLLIEFNESALNNLDIVENWLTKVEKYTESQ
ncbi:MAG: hypothetical protein KGZ94_09330 [Clostridia bacterium]|nr:hypothetical protein [Clostridia bacterium]